ncbi:ZP domain-containing protein, partial [Trichostrongylus colubriformis]
MIPTTELEARHGIPGCSYSIHRSSIEDLDEGRPAGPPIQFARVGDRVLHQWHCNDKMFGVLINNCYVTDGFGKKADVINDKGCPVDPILITGIRYSSDLQRAYAESSVFKFADKPGVWFFCQIQMCMKKAGMCQGITPPSCASVAPPLEEGGERETTEGGRRRTTTAPDYFQADQRRTTAEYEYPDETKKLHSPISPSPYATTPPLDYDLQTEAVTIFGPAFPAPEESERRGGARVTTASVTQFEIEEDRHELTTTKSTKSGKSDYNDYEDVTIPPNLTDLLANLPDDLSPETLQKMFRDSVDDRRALLEGFDLLKNQLKVDWMTGRRRDPPPPSDDDQIARNRVTSDASDKPMIAGQLMIFELDEEPPEVEGRARSGRGPHSGSSTSSSSACAISKVGLFAVAGGLGAVCAALFIAVLTMFIKLSRTDGLCSGSFI